MKIKSERGFGHIELFGMIVVVALIAIAGVRILDHGHALSSPNPYFIIPSNNSTVSGSVVIDLGVTNWFQPYNTVAVSANGNAICNATATLYGFLCKWNSTAVKNGSYKLTATYTTPGGAYSASPYIVTVNNGTPKIGPVTSLHYTSNANFNSNGNYLPGSYGFNLADISSSGDLSELPSGVKALAYIGLCNGANAAFTSTIQPYIGKTSVYGFYLMDEPDPTSCPPANLKAESNWIHANDPGTKTFIIMSNLSSSKSPSFVGSYNPSNSGLDLFGLDPYPCRTELNGCNYSTITAYVSAAEAEGVPQADIVPVYQTFGGGTETDDGGGYWQLPTATQEDSILSTWKYSVPTPAFDYAYSWGTQFGDQSLSGSTALQQVFATQNAQ